MLQPDSEVVEQVLKLLRQWGWETGPKKLQQEIEATADPKKQEALQFFAGWMAAEHGPPAWC